jgi:hypothetical protein
MVRHPIPLRAPEKPDHSGRSPTAKLSSEPDFDAGGGAVPTIWLAILMAADAQNSGDALPERDRESRISR